jgi:hypothetical protein
MGRGIFAGGIERCSLSSRGLRQVLVSIIIYTLDLSAGEGLTPMDDPLQISTVKIAPQQVPLERNATIPIKYVFSSTDIFV